MWPLRSQRHAPRHVKTSDGPPEMLAIMKSSQDQAALANFARSNGWDLTMLNTLPEASALSAKPNTAVIILDRDLTENDWRPAVHSFAQHRPAPCIILASSVLDEYLFDEIVKQGGFDIVAKPIRPDELRRIGGLAVTFWKNRSASRSSE